MMSESIKAFEKDVDLLLTEVAMTGAVYGLEKAVAPVIDHLAEMPRTKGAALLAGALGRISTKQYDSAITLLTAMVDDPEMAKYKDEAAGFLALAYKLKGDSSAFNRVVADLNSGLGQALKS
jgi:hypothetical protein